MNAEARVTPFSLVLGGLAAERFPALREGITAAERDPRDRDGFLMVKEAVELLRELEPEEGLGEGIATMAAFLHQSYLYWMDGERTVTVEDRALEVALSQGAPASSSRTPACSVYVQLPLLRVWAVPVEGGPAEPLDGWFASRAGERLSILGIFGLHPGRAGFTAVDVAGPWPFELERNDGSPLFAPVIPGAAQAGLASIVGAEELLELAWRIHS